MLKKRKMYGDRTRGYDVDGIRDDLEIAAERLNGAVDELSTSLIRGKQALDRGDYGSAAVFLEDLLRRLAKLKD